MLMQYAQWFPTCNKLEAFRPIHISTGLHLAPEIVEAYPFDRTVSGQPCPVSPHCYRHGQHARP